INNNHVAPPLGRTSAATIVRVYLPRSSREALATLRPDRRAALREGFLRVGWHLLDSAERVEVDAGWSRHTWPLRRYPPPRSCRHTRPAQVQLRDWLPHRCRHRTSGENDSHAQGPWQ